MSLALTSILPPTEAFVQAISCESLPALLRRVTGAADLDPEVAALITKRWPLVPLTVPPTTERTWLVIQLDTPELFALTTERTPKHKDNLDALIP